MTRAEQIRTIDWAGWIKSLLPVIIAILAFIAMINRLQFSVSADEIAIKKHEAIIEELQKGIADIRTSQALTNQHLEAIQKALDKLEK